MRNVLFAAAMVLAAIPAGCFAQNGTDIDQAIPIYFGQTINDNLDTRTRTNQVYSLTLGKGQQITVTATANAGVIIYLGDSSVHTIKSASWLKQAGYSSGVTITYETAASGVYYVSIGTNATGTTYKLQVTAQGPIVPVNTFTSASCVTGQVDYILYSLQLIAAGLPDEASVGGQKMCASCAIKPPAYPELVNKMEKAMGLGLNVSACYDSGGNLGQLKLIHP